LLNVMSNFSVIFIFHRHFSLVVTPHLAVP